MKTTIYFFTGTGNSLKIGQMLAEKLDECELKPIAKFLQMEKIVSLSEKIGFVFPLYYFGLPKIVYDFVSKLELKIAKYIFAVITSAEDITDLPLQQLERILAKKDKELDAGFFFTMPNNYIIGFDITSKKKQKELFETAIKQVDGISKIIMQNGTTLKEFGSERIRADNERKNELFRETVNDSDESFYADENCNSCGICEKVCPINNILLVEGKPKWQHNCQLCLACINFCPEKSIQFGTETLKTQRYHHPEITLQEVINQK